MALPTVTGTFRVVKDPEIRYSEGGVAFTKFRAVADKQKKVNDQWVDDKIIWVNVVCFKKVAENVAESVSSGDLVTVTGQISTSEYTTDSGEKRFSVDIAADQVGYSLARDSITGATRPERSSRPAESAPSENPWGPPAAAGGEPPF